MARRTTTLLLCTCSFTNLACAGGAVSPIRVTLPDALLEHLYSMPKQQQQPLQPPVSLLDHSPMHPRDSSSAKHYHQQIRVQWRCMAGSPALKVAWPLATVRTLPLYAPSRRLNSVAERLRQSPRTLRRPTVSPL